MAFGVHRNQPIPQVGDSLQHAKNHECRIQADAGEQRAASKRTDNGRDQTQSLVDRAHFGRSKACAANQESRGQTACEGVAELV